MRRKYSVKRSQINPSLAYKLSRYHGIRICENSLPCRRDVTPQASGLSVSAQQWVNQEGTGTTNPLGITLQERQDTNAKDVPRSPYSRYNFPWKLPACAGSPMPRKTLLLSSRHLPPYTRLPLLSMTSPRVHTIPPRVTHFEAPKRSTGGW